MAKCEVDYQIFDVANLEFGQWEKERDVPSDGSIICFRSSKFEFMGLDLTVKEWSDQEGTYIIDLYKSNEWTIIGDRVTFNSRVIEMLSEKLIDSTKWETIECSK